MSEHDNDNADDDANDDAQAPAKGAAKAAGEGEKPSLKDADTGDDAPASGWTSGEEAVAALKAEAGEAKDRLLRTLAEMENLRRRTERDKADSAKYAISSFARDILSVADNMQRAMEHVPADEAEKSPVVKSLLDGVHMTERELLKVLERHGVTRDDPKGARFDPNLHQAVFEVPNPDVPAGTVVEVMQPGYRIADRVLRPAMVGVSAGGPKPAKPEDASTGPGASTQEPAAKGETGARVDRSA